MSMAQVKQLIKGFLKTDKKTWISACSSITLIQTLDKDNRPLNIIVDTGGKEYEKRIKKELRKHGLTRRKVDIVINTHSHPDHTWNNAFFKNAKFIKHNGILTDKFYFLQPPIQVAKDVEVIKTPGHTDDSCSVIVHTEEGVYAIVGDLIATNREKVAPFEKDKKQIEKYRRKVKTMADFIIPGHGEIYKVEK